MTREPTAVDAPGTVPDQPSRRPLKYRSDIDGLRSVAVLSVIFFHLGYKSFSGGWIGVDVFFVISGFLITRLIADEADRGAFSFDNFYARRARRLFSSFIFTIAASFLGGSLIFDPVYRQHSMVWIGKISYSLYPIHWPIIVFYKYHRLTPLTPIEQGRIVLGSLALASLMYVFIEQPFRNPGKLRFSSNAALGLSCTASMIIVLIPASVIWAKGSLLWRGSALTISDAQLQQVEEQRKPDEVDNLLAHRAFGAADSRQRLMFVGDSHGGDIAPALFLTLGSNRFDYARLGFDDPCFSTADRRPWILRMREPRSRRSEVRGVMFEKSH